MATQQCGRMTSVAYRNGAMSGCASADQSGVLSGQRAVTEQPACAFGKLIDAEAKRNETPENSVEFRHEHRSCNALARNIAEDEIDSVVTAGNDVNIVAADQAGRFVTVVEMPAIGAEVVAGQ